MGGKDVAVVDELGQVGTLPESEARAALLDGRVSLANDQQFKRAKLEAEFDTTGGQAMALGAGALRGLSMGLSDPALVEAGKVFGGGYSGGEEVARVLRGTQEVNPGTSMVGEGLGMVGGAFLPGGGLGAVGRAAEGGVARVLGSGALAKIGGKALAGGAELGLYGGSSELSRELTEEALGNSALNGEHIAADAAHNFLIGAAFGGAVGVGGALKDSIASRLFRRGRAIQSEAEAMQAQQAAEELRASATAEAGAAADARATTGGAQSMAGEINVNAGGVEGPSLMERGGKLRQGLEGIAKGTKFEDLAKGKWDLDSVLNWLDDASAESVIKGAGRKIKSVRALDEGFADGGSVGAGRRMRKEIPEALGKKGYGEISGPAEVYEGAEIVRKGYGAKLEELESRFTSKEAKAALPSMTLSDVYNQLDAKLGERMNALGNSASLNKFNALKEIEMPRKLGLAPGTPASEASVTLGQLRDMSKDLSKMFEKNDPMMKAIKNEIEGMVMRRVEVIAEASKNAADRNLLARYKDAKQGYLASKKLGEIAKEGMSQQTQNVFGGIPGAIAGVVGGGLGTMVAGPFGGFIGQGIGQLGSAAIRRKAPQLMTQYLQREYTTELAKSIGAISRESSDALKEAFTPATKVAPSASVKFSATQMFGANADARAQAVAKATSALDAASIGERFAKASSTVASGAPNIAREAASSLGRAVAYLRANAPQPVNISVGLVPWATKPTYRDEDVNRWAKQWGVVADWKSVLRAAQAGTLGRVEVDTLKQVYPKKFEALRSEFMSLMFDEKHQEKMKKMPLEQSLSVAMLFGIPTALTAPDFLREIQAAHGEEQTPPESSSPPKGGAGNAASSIATDMDPSPGLGD